MAESSPTQGFSRLNPEITGRFKKGEDPKPTRGHKTLEWVLFGIFAVLLVVGGIAVYTVFSSKHRAVPNSFDAGLRQDRINLLLIGVGGEMHQGRGQDLADAIILASLKPSTRQVAVVSVPRDFYTSLGRYGSHRLNQAHDIGGQSGYPGGGPGLTIDTVSQIFQQPIHGFIKLDFKAFEKIIDSLGGVDIYVQRSFYDYLWREGFRAGWEKMDGNRALKYARYRFVIGFEGDNYARELRQQQVIAAVREKLKKRNPNDVMGLINTVRALSANTDTNLSTTHLVWLYRNFGAVSPGQIRNVSLKPFMEKFTLESMSDPGEAVRTRTGNLDELRRMAGPIFSDMRQIRTADQIEVDGTSTIPAEGPVTSTLPPPQTKP